MVRLGASLRWLLTRWAVTLSGAGLILGSLWDTRDHPDAWMPIVGGLLCGVVPLVLCLAIARWLSWLFGPENQATTPYDT